MEQVDLQKKIKEKFKTISAFGRAAKIDRYELQKAFMPAYATNPHYIELRRKLNEDVDRLQVGMNDDDLTKERITALREAIQNYGGKKKFCEENPNFSFHSVGQILSGQRQKIAGVTKELMDFFKIE